jgi:hypothetical protein
LPAGSLNPFYGTSAAAPHAAAIAALLKSYNQNLTPSQIRTILTNTALNIMSAGVDRDSGAGIVMALPALQQSPVPTPVVAPASIIGNAMGGIITSGDYPFTASGGYFLFIPANSGNTYQLVEVDDESGLYSILTGSGTYSYTASGSSGLFQFVQGSDTFKGNLNFVTTNIGSYLITNVSVAPIVASETGEYELYQVAVPASIASKTFRCFIQNGISPFATTGTFDFKVAPSGAGYAIVDSETGITNSTGTCSYSKLNSSTGQVQANDAALGSMTEYVVFSDAVEGNFLATQASFGGFQVGHFVLVDTTSPSLNIQFPAAGARLINALITVQGTATDDVQVAGVGYQLNTNGWTAATGSTNWTAANLMLVPGTNNFSAYAVDTSGNVSATNSVRFDFVVTNQLQIRTIGLGTISPNYSNAWLEIGRNYSITSAPASGFVFTNWLISTNWIGGAFVTGTNLQFMMQSNLTLQATFLDVTKPMLTITAPTANQKMTNALATVIGTAADNWQVSNVWYQLNGGAWSMGTTTNSFTNWTSPLLTLLAGTNSLNAYALDLAGNISTTNSVSFVSSNAFKLQMSFALAQPLTTTGLNFSLQISPGLNGHIQVSTNLATWATLTNFVGTNTTLNFRDPAATNSSHRFYRAVIP